MGERSRLDILKDQRKHLVDMMHDQPHAFGELESLKLMKIQDEIEAIVNSFQSEIIPIELADTEELFEPQQVDEAPPTHFVVVKYGIEKVVMSNIFEGEEAEAMAWKCWAALTSEKTDRNVFYVVQPWRQPPSKMMRVEDMLVTYLSTTDLEDAIRHVMNKLDMKPIRSITEGVDQVLTIQLTRFSSVRLSIPNIHAICGSQVIDLVEYIGRLQS